jgi:hypothetical protein
LLAANFKSSVTEEPAPIGENKLIAVSFEGDCIPLIYTSIVSDRANIVCLLMISKRLCVTCNLLK